MSSIWLYNNTEEPITIAIENNSSMPKVQLFHRQSFVITVQKDIGLLINDSIILMVGDDMSVDVIKDDLQQINGVGGDFLRKWGVPIETDHAFLISNPEKGDF